MTNDGYMQNVKPFFDKIFAISKDMTTSEQIVMGSFLAELAKNEFKPEVLKNMLSSDNITKLQAKFFEEKGMKKELEKAQQFLSN